MHEREKSLPFHLLLTSLYNINNKARVKKSICLILLMFVCVLTTGGGDDDAGGGQNLINIRFFSKGKKTASFCPHFASLWFLFNLSPPSPWRVLWRGEGGAMCLIWRKNIDLLSNVPLLALSVNEKTVAHLLRYFQKGRAEGKEEGGSTYLVVFHWRSWKPK